MRACVFVGPTISREQVLSTCECVCLPPAAQGDLYRAALAGPVAIGVIDGYFHGVPSVWHKEILWAMAQGIHVFGSSSMGALRAAELDAFGMRGVGRIFEHYRDGTLEDDDEVAVLHGPREADFMPLSEPMVNIRATLERATREGVIGERSRKVLCDFAKSLYYQKRTWDAVLSSEHIASVPSKERAAMREWLEIGRVDRKREDALEMLELMSDHLSSTPEPLRVSYDFEWTHFFDSVTEYALENESAAHDHGEVLPLEELVDELRLDPEAFHRASRRALLRMLAVRETRRRRMEITPGMVRDRKIAFRLQQRLFNRNATDEWLARNQMSEVDLDQLAEEEARLDALSSETARGVRDYLISELRSSDEFARMLERARDKRETLSSLGLMHAQPGELDVAPPQLLAWYFESRLKTSIPDDLDAYIARLGLAHRDAFYRILIREHVYLSHKFGS